MDKVLNAINVAYDRLNSVWLHGGKESKYNIDLAMALDQLAPFYHNPRKIYDEVEKAFWIGAMDARFGEKLDRLTEGEKQEILGYLIDESRRTDDEISDLLYDAAEGCGLTNKLYDDCDEDEEEGC